MLLSMTGHGEAQREQGGAIVSVELRTVNNRFLKISTRLSEGFGSLEPMIEAVVREHLRRGTVQANVRIERQPSPDDYHLNEVVLTAYRQQVERLQQQAGVTTPVRLEMLLALPGVVSDGGPRNAQAEQTGPLVEQLLRVALENLQQMRADEGSAMARDLSLNCRLIAAELEMIEQRAPAVVEAYRQRLSDRVNKLLQEHELDLQPSDIVRELGIFADRSDISEETVRLRSHLEQFAATTDGQDSNGRKLEFIIQEMLRETNTIGSKANDAQIARHVVEIKTAIERMREMVQNVE